jgi:hypothetical protein
LHKNIVPGTLGLSAGDITFTVNESNGSSNAADVTATVGSYSAFGTINYVSGELKLTFNNPAPLELVRCSYTRNYNIEKAMNEMRAFLSYSAVVGYGDGIVKDFSTTLTTDKSLLPITKGSVEIFVDEVKIDARDFEENNTMGVVTGPGIQGSGMINYLHGAISFELAETPSVYSKIEVRFNNRVRDIEKTAGEWLAPGSDKEKLVKTFTNNIFPYVRLISRDTRAGGILAKGKGLLDDSSRLFSATPEGLSGETGPQSTDQSIILKHLAEHAYKDLGKLTQLDVKGAAGYLDVFDFE